MTKFFLDQHGCAKNQVDGELILARLAERGYERTLDAGEAQVIIVNSCGIIEDAKKESLAAVFNARAAYPAAKVVLAGCLAARYAADFAESLPEADAVIGGAALGDALDRVLAGERVVRAAAGWEAAPAPRKELLSFPGAAYVKVSEGCSNRCSFCAIPAIRGPLRSRPQEDIVREIAGLLAAGVFEINLVAQDIASYGADFAPQGAGRAKGQSPLSRLLRALSALPGAFWLRLLYMHPDRFPRDILAAFRDDPRILPYFDLPFQSGSDPIIRAMNRTGTAESYAALVQEIRAYLAPRTPVFRTTFLCGFPGETRDDAERTEDFLRRIEPDWSGAFVYSREEGTGAYSYKNRPLRRTARARAERLAEIQAEITAKKLASCAGAEQLVLIEESLAAPGPSAAHSDPSAAGEDFAIGRAWFQAPEVDGATVIRLPRLPEARQPLPAPGSLVRARITGARPPDLTAEWFTES